MPNPIANAVLAKGLGAFVDRARMIAQRYSLTPATMARALAQFADILGRYSCGATFPTTAIAVQRHPQVIPHYQEQGIEFCVHGYTHIDYADVSPEVQREHLVRARDIFAQAGIATRGFRSPYLRRNAHLNTAIREAGFEYVSNQPVLWNIVDTATLEPDARMRYERAHAYYAGWNADQRVVTPRLLENGLIEIPVSLPDDEILMDRLNSAPDGLIVQAWPDMLKQSYARGELFTLQLHPERTLICAQGLVATLDLARRMQPEVWCARLDEIAAWWEARAEAAITLDETAPGEYHITLIGPERLALQVGRVIYPVTTHTLTLKSARRPCIAATPRTAATLIAFLREQGYIVEVNAQTDDYAYVIDQPTFAEETERTLMATLEAVPEALLRLSRWPDGCQSALAITGDIDAFTLFDYALRFAGR